MSSHFLNEKEPDTTINIALDILSELAGQVWLPVNGDSMAPLIKDGDQVLVDLYPRDVRPGEVVLIQRNDGLITHRLLALSDPVESEATILTKGDNRVVSDPVTAKARLIGKVSAVQHNERRLWLNTRSWRIINWNIAKVMLMQAKLYQIFWRLNGDRPSSMYGFLAQVIRSANHASLQLIKFLAERWSQ